MGISPPLLAREKMLIKAAPCLLQLWQKSRIFVPQLHQLWEILVHLLLLHLLLLLGSENDDGAFPPPASFNKGEDGKGVASTAPPVSYCHSACTFGRSFTAASNLLLIASTYTFCTP